MIIDFTKLNIDFPKTKRKIERVIGRYINDRTKVFKESNERIASTIGETTSKTNRLYNSKIEKVVLHRTLSAEKKRCEELEACISMLSEKEKLMIELYFIENLSIRKIMMKTQLREGEVNRIFKEAVIKLAILKGCLVINDELIKGGQSNAKK